VPESGAIHTFPLDGGAALYRERSCRLHILNPTASLLWRSLGRGESAAVVARRAARRFRVPLDRVEKDFAAALAQFESQGLLGPMPDPVPAPPAPALRPATLALAPAERQQRHYRIAGSSFSVATTAAGWWLIEPVIAHLAEPAGAAGLAIEICPHGAQFALNVGGHERIRTASTARLQAALLRVVAGLACADPRWLAVLHAGAVARDGRCFVFPAQGGSGKTTLVAALMRAGYGVLGDDIVALDDATLQLAPLPLPLRIKRDGWPLVGRWFPELHAGAVHADGAKRIRLLVPRAPAGDAWRAGHEVTCLISLARRASAAPRLEPCSHLEMLQVLFGANAMIAGTCDARRVRRVLQWVRSRPAYRLVYGEAEDAVALLDRLRAT
jgi:hypothetical protein